MNTENEVNSKKNIAAKIIVPILLICIVAGIWAVKNLQKGNSPLDEDNPDFSLHATEKIDLEKLKSYNLPIIIDFGADSCIPCKEMAPVLKELNEELRGKAIIKFVDVWKYQTLAESYPISLIPTQILVDAEGKPYSPKDPVAEQMKLYALQNTNEHVFTAHEGGMTKEQILSTLRAMGMEE